MTYIKKYGIALPHFRISDKVLHPRLGREVLHAVCYADEDIITLAWQAAEKLGDEVDAVLFATTTPVFKGRYHASYLADLLGLPDGITALDVGTTHRAGTDALLLADALITGGKHGNVLVVASSISYPAIGKEVQTPFGHGAVAMILSKDKGIAQITHAASYSEAFAEEFVYKGGQVKYDARFAGTAGFLSNMKKVLAGLTPQGTSSLIINSAYVKLIFNALKKGGYDLEKQVAPDKLVPRFGFLGAAHGLLRLAFALENTPGISVLVDYNNGSNVITFDVAKNTAPVSSDSGNTTAIASYQDYLTLRKRGKFDGRGYESIEMFSSEMMQEREKSQFLRLKAFECKSCGTVYYLKAARCNNCKGTDFREKQLSKTGTVYTLTSEYYFPISFPPANMIVIDLDGGGRITVQQTDDMYQDEHTKISIGDKVKLVLRKMMENDKKPNYFWKCVKL
ncbi:MAG: hydroxymethylglutaryl-CoA synthase family protein [Saprospiraceae bacterium]|nr:MAG: hydroxymethylglutaryl-CoA synthase family protein [Saprospiraceae bacterium]